ncbi:DUF305 domain-containing protein [Intrasporangium calvum]|uniref:DUF305 domain-containing protein n=1 Tax=Intrasporangium calvum (strain ATCC 23552 / DSM 43043 / JCM 3097 / NBRC 12989 / NCIMB 10167 / NRRL B-3866 / 7 KIP) TaxID=710696 RepID=E6SD65_INTC7|nr:DUF305 domain-containing protein [Intrasporangium calvum]ADU49683.1 protein of unknown function DUF305 [Intrasporangium calvum DSM 43043]
MSPLRRAARPVAALSLALVLAACGSSDGSGAGTHQGDSSSSSSSVSAARSGDIMFAQMMIPHHEQAVEMAEVALAKDGVSEQVKALATNIKGAQGPEIQTMTAWLKQWNASPLASGNTDHGGGHGTGMMSEQDMGSLSAAEGAEFDRQWLTMMIEHHEGAIEMADNVLATTSDAQVKALAEAIISGQEAEITTMKGLLS